MITDVQLATEQREANIIPNHTNMKKTTEELKIDIYDWIQENKVEIDDSGYEMGGSSVIVCAEDLIKFLDSI